MGNPNVKQVHESAWVTDVITQEDAGVVVAMPKEIFEAMNLKPGEALLWTLLPNNLGFTVNKVANSFKSTGESA